MGLFGFLKNNKVKEENKTEEQAMPTAEQIIRDAANLREDKENKEEDIPEIISAFYDIDTEYVKEILNNAK